MKFTAREDIEAPIAEVFAVISDFDAFERLGRSRGVQVARRDHLGAKAVGMGWELRFDWRGRTRVLLSDLTRYDPPQAMVFHASSGGYDMTLSVTLVALAARRTRLGTELEVRPRTLAARLVIQSLRLGRTRLTRRFRTRVAAFAREIEATARLMPAGTQA